MDYKKKYEEAERLYRTANADQRYVLESLFPKLRESEDERTRNFLIDYINHIDWGDWDFSRKQCIDWLEKQGEKKSQRMISAEAKEAMYDKPAWSEEDKDVINHLLAICNGAKKFIQFESCSREDIIKCQDWLTSLKERI